MLQQVQRRVGMRRLDVHAEHWAAALQLLLQAIHRRAQNPWLREEVLQWNPGASATRAARTARTATEASDMGAAGAVRRRIQARLEW